ncbi:carbohydrate-binding protein [Kitasatospora paranensis]|uniref:Carbohydrate-binding protein n=1 Tax=Kitasatospora paranensis TaxID=258053 RepID=A0ABW2G6J4_9ACTN
MPHPSVPGRRRALAVATALAALLCAVPMWAAVPALGAEAPLPAVAEPDAGPANPWVLTNTAFDPADYLKQPFVGNGYLSQRLPAVGQGFQQSTDTSGWPLGNNRYTSALVAGVYDSETGTHNSAGSSDFIAALPTWSTMNLGVGGSTLDANVPSGQITGYQQTLDQRNATVSTSMTWTPAAGKATAVKFDVLANRDVMNLGQVQVTVTPAWSGSLSLTGLLDGLGANRITADPASARTVDTTAHTSTVRLITPGRNTKVTETQRLVAGPGATITAATAQTPSGNLATVGEQWTVPVTAGQTYTFTKYVGISTSNETATPDTVSATTVTDAANSGWPALLTRHQNAWAKLWAPNVTAAGRNDVQAAVYSSFYLLYSSLREGVSWSIPPAGLSSDNYAGVIFWDADTWMYPTLLAFHPELARSVVMFRFNTLAAAKANAAGVTSRALKGGSWAWDNGPSGTCGGLNGCPSTQDHLQNDISLAQWQYYQATGDLAWLKSYGYPVLKALADFWASRVDRNADGTYHVNGVQSADEYAWNVNDESSTNAGAVVALRNAVLAAQAAGQSADPVWTTIADHLVVPVDPDGTHPEYAGFTNRNVKQAATVMMTYPTGYVTDPAVAAADLTRYLPLMDAGGPAMTASVEAVIAAYAQTPGCLTDTLLRNSYAPFLRGPFQQFLETKFTGASAGQGNPAFNFATGAGGFLQTFPYGLAGLRWQQDALVLNPMLTPQLGGGVTLTGLQYQGRSVNVEIGAQNTKVSLVSGNPITVKFPTGPQTLAQGSPLTVPTARPDLVPTSNQARCQTAKASSALSDNPPAAAVDGSTATVWTAASTAPSSLAVTLAPGKQTSRADIQWGPTRPANYEAWVQSTAGWTKEATGAVPASGDLHVSWPATATQAVTFTFSGGGAASIAELALPDPASSCAVTAVCEAETGTLSGGASIQANHAGSTGSGFVAGLYPGATDTLTVNVPTAGTYSAVIRYANSTGGKDPGPYLNVTRTVSLTAGGTTVQVQLPTTANWDTWGTVNVPVTLTSGDNTIQLAVGPNDSGSINLDSITVTAPACAVTAVCEAEKGILAGGATTEANHAGYTGSGFVAGLYPGATDTLRVTTSAAGTHHVSIRYANSTGGRNPGPYLNVTRTVSLTAGGTTVQVQLPTTANWDTWGTVNVPVTLTSGDNTIQLAVGPNDSGSINLDSITVTAG